MYTAQINTSLGVPAVELPLAEQLQLFIRAGENAGRIPAQIFVGVRGFETLRSAVYDDRISFDAKGAPDSFLDVPIEIDISSESLRLVCSDLIDKSGLSIADC